MLTNLSPLSALRRKLDGGASTPLKFAQDVIQRANGNASHNTYIRFEPSEILRDVKRLAQEFPGEKPPLFGVPVSLKDCFDLAGTQTTCGSRFYAGSLPAAAQDSAMAQRIRRAGGLITGKTHLHPLAYGITGQNPEYGACVQPRDVSLLTGGSSSGAAASVQEGSALVAIGTDTGGSIRVPAALCGLVGYRASHGLGVRLGIWSGAAHLAPSFDTIGFLLRDPRDAQPVAHALFDVPFVEAPKDLRIGFVPDAFLVDCEPDVMQAYAEWKTFLTTMGARVEEFSTETWMDTLEIFAGIQAHEAAGIHRGHYDEFEPAIRDRLRWGASLTSNVLDGLRERLLMFREGLRAVLTRFDLLMLPCAPVSRLRVGDDLSNARQVILRYTTPFSLGGLPALSLPGEMIGAPFGTGVQMAATPDADAMLLAFARAVGDRVAEESAMLS